MRKENEDRRNQINVVRLKARPVRRQIFPTVLLVISFIFVLAGCSSGPNLGELGQLARVETVSECLAISNSVGLPENHVTGIWHEKDLSNNLEYNRISDTLEEKQSPLFGSSCRNPFGDDYFEITSAGNLVLVFHLVGNPWQAVLLGEPACTVMAFCFDGRQLKELNTSFGTMDMSNSQLRVGIVENGRSTKVLRLTWKVVVENGRRKIVEAKNGLILYRSFPLKELAERRDERVGRLDRAWKKSRSRSNLDLLGLNECPVSRTTSVDVAGYWIDPYSCNGAHLREIFQDGSLVVSATYLEPPFLFGSLDIMLYCARNAELDTIFETYRYPMGFRSGGCETLPAHAYRFRIADQGTELNRISAHYYDVFGTCDIKEFKQHDFFRDYDKSGCGEKQLYRIGSFDQHLGGFITFDVCKKDEKSYFNGCTMLLEWLKEFGKRLKCCSNGSRQNNFPVSPGRKLYGWTYSIVPLWYNFIRVNRQFTHLLIADLNARLVVPAHEVSTNPQAGSGPCCAKVLEHSLVAVQGTACPVLTDLAVEPVLDGIPLRSTAWQVGNSHRETVTIANFLLNTIFPCSAPWTVTSTSVGKDSKLA